MFKMKKREFNKKNKEFMENGLCGKCKKERELDKEWVRICKKCFDNFLHKIKE